MLSDLDPGPAAPDPAPSPTAWPDAAPPALCEGTPLATPSGEHPAGMLDADAEVTTADGRRRPVRWIGWRDIRPDLIPPGGRDLWTPVRIRRDAIAPGQPTRDVLVSPTLGIAVDGALVAAADLVDGHTILREPPDRPIRYAQLALDEHALLLAAGLPVESYADRGDRNAFANVLDWPGGGGPRVALPRADAATCARLRRSIFQQARFPGRTFSPDPGLSLLADGRTIPPDSVRDGLYSFQVAGPVAELRLLSRTLVPAEQTPGSTDQRRLGVSLWWIRLGGEHVGVELRSDHPLLQEGFHEPEEGARWTDGYALVPPRFYQFLAGTFTVEVMIGSPDVAYAVEPAADRQRALVVDETVPTPDRDAGSNVILAHVRLLQSLGFAVTFLPANLAAPSPYAEALEAEGVELAAHPFVGGLEPFLALRGPSFALAYLHRVTVATRALPLLRRLAPQTRILFNPADLHHLRLQREAALLGSEEVQAEAEAVRPCELGTIAGSDVTLLCNTHEVELVRAELPEARLVYLPWVITPPAGPRPGFAAREGLMFLGGFAHRPNVDGLTWFVTEVMPTLRVLVPGVMLHVYGHGVPEAVAGLACEDVRIEGYVADLASAFDRHRLSVVPLRFGAGFKGKLAESLAHGVPAVATTVAAEGTGLQDGEQILVADEPQAFAVAVATLYTTADLWERLVEAGLQDVAAAFSPEAGRARLQEALVAAGVTPPA